MLRVEVAPLAEGLHTLTLHPTPADLGLDGPALHALDAVAFEDVSFQEVRVDLRLDVADRRILAHIEVSARVGLACDRTLQPYDARISGAHTVLYASPELAPESDEDDAVMALADDATSIDLTRPVRDTLLLAIPLRRVSPEAEATDIPTSFGRNPDDLADDRWEALRGLRSSN